MKRIATVLSAATLVAACTPAQLSQVKDVLPAAVSAQPTLEPSATPTPTPLPSATAVPTPSASPSATASPSPSPSPAATPTPSLQLINAFDGRGFSIGMTSGWGKSSGGDGTQIGNYATMHLICRNFVDGNQVGLMSVSSWLLQTIPMKDFIDLLKKTMKEGNQTFTVESDFKAPYLGFVGNADVIGSLPNKVERFHFYFLNLSEAAYIIHFRHNAGAFSDEQVRAMVDSFKWK